MIDQTEGAEPQCPHCRRETMEWRFMSPDGHWIITYRCNHCQKDVVPTRNIICNLPLAAIPTIG